MARTGGPIIHQPRCWYHHLAIGQLLLHPAFEGKQLHLTSLTFQSFVIGKNLLTPDSLVYEKTGKPLFWTGHGHVWNTFRISFGKTKWVERGKWKLMVDPNPSFHECESLSKYEDLHSISIEYAQMKRNGIQYMYIYSLYKHYYIQFTFI